MPSSLIIYSSTDGHTKKICKHITNFLDDRDGVKLVSLNEATKLDLEKFNKIIIGASIRYGKHSKELYKFVELNKIILEKKRSTFFFSKCCCKKV